MMKKLSAGVLGIVFLGMVSLSGASVQAAEVTLKVLDPRAEHWTPPVKPIQPRLKTLDGKKIAIINNTKPGAAYIRPFIEKVLKEKYPTVEFKEYMISYNAYPNKSNELKEVASWADGVIGMLGD